MKGPSSDVWSFDPERMEMTRLMTILLLATAAWAVAGCEGTPGGPQPAPGPPAEIRIVGAPPSSAPVATLLSAPIGVQVLDASGQPLSGIQVRFMVAAGGGWAPPQPTITDVQGMAFTPWILGPRPGTVNRLSIQAEAASASTQVTALPIPPGSPIFGREGYVEYRPGTLPVVLTAPHGGSMEPAEIPDRTVGTFVQDRRTIELSEAIADSLEARTGGRPHLVILHLHRRKLDANRDLDEAAQGNRHADRAWHEFHLFTEAALIQVEEQGRDGFYIDVHGHGHPIQRLELGYLLTGADLALTNPELDLIGARTKSSVGALADRRERSHASLIRGNVSLGALWEARGFPTVPSPMQPSPAGEPYFTGGYNTRRHTCASGTFICGVQLEANWDGVRSTAAHRAAFAGATAAILSEYFTEVVGLPLAPSSGAP